MKAVVGGRKHKNMEYKGVKTQSFHRTRNSNSEEWESKDSKANKRSVWTVATKPFKEAHFATFPEELIAPCILAGSPPEGIVLDMFSGAGTTALTALKYNRRFLASELNPEYVKMSIKRIKPYLLQKQLF